MENNLSSFNYTLNNAFSQGQKKKYSKVNEVIRQQFLQYIIQNNMSIKEASQTLNINYSSAKAILANHRKTMIQPPRYSYKTTKQANYRILTPLEAYLPSIEELVCSTGGKEVSRRGDALKRKPIHKATFILFSARKQHQSLENTSNSQNE